MNKEEIKTRLRDFFQKEPFKTGIRKVSLFGSYVNGTPREDSDIDLLVEFSAPIGFFDLIRIQKKIEAALGKAVDLVTPSALSKYFRSEVVAEAEPVYER